MPTCNRCQQTLPAGSERCPACGAWAVEMNEPGSAAADAIRGQVQRLLRQGRKIEAIRIYREATGLGLAESKAAVEAIAANRVSEILAQSSESDRPLIERLAAGDKIGAIKLYRERHGSGLKEAKDAVEALVELHGIRRSQAILGPGILVGLAVLLAIAALVWKNVH